MRVQGRSSKLRAYSGGGLLLYPRNTDIKLKDLNDLRMGIYLTYLGTHYSCNSMSNILELDDA